MMLSRRTAALPLVPLPPISRALARPAGCFLARRPGQFAPLQSFISARRFSSSPARNEEATTDLFSQTYEELKTVQKEMPQEKVTQAQAVVRNLSISTKRLDPLIRQIRGLSYKEAVTQLKFCNMRIGPEVTKLIERARTKAELRYNLNAERLVLHEIYYTKGQYGFPMIDYKAKGRFGIKRKRTSHLTVVLKEIPHQEGEKKLGKFARGVNKEKRLEWQAKAREVGKELNINPLYLTTKQVELWPLYKEKVLNPKVEAMKKRKEREGREVIEEKVTVLGREIVLRV